MSFFHLLHQCSWVVVGVLFVLAASSVWSWAVIFAKWVMLRSARREADIAIDNFTELALERGDYHRFGEDRAFSYLVAIASQECQRRSSHGMNPSMGSTIGHMGNAMGGAMGAVRPGDDLSQRRNVNIQRLEYLMQIHIDQQHEYMLGHLTTLNIIGNLSLLVGLFGTVWSVMDVLSSFGTGQVSMSAIGPGVSEMLFVTAMGIVTALPASVAYYRYMRSVQKYMTRMENFAQTIVAALLRN